MIAARLALTLFIVSLIVRLSLFYGFLSQDNRHHVYFDSDQYQTIAEKIVEGKGCALHNNQPQTYRLPGYSLFLAAVYSVVGIHEHAAMVVQIIISSTIPVLIYLLSTILLPTAPIVGLCAAIVSCFHIGFVLYSGMLATESLFVFFFLLFLLGFYTTLFQRSQWYYVFGAGVALGCASLIRPVGLPLLILACLMLLIRWGFSGKSMRSILSLLLSWSMTVAPWLIRNYCLMGALFFHTLPGLHFLQYTATKIIMQADQLTYVEARARALDEWQQVIVKQEESTGEKLNDYRRCCLGERLALSYAFRYPVSFLYNSMLEMFKTTFSLYSAQMIFADKQEWTEYKTGVGTLWAKIQRYFFPSVNTWWLTPLTHIEIIFHILLVLSSALFVLCGLWSEKERKILLYTLPFIFLFIGLTCAYGCARLRLPFEPFLVIYAGGYWSWIMKKYYKIMPY
jgi:4-amino-4-deoxy-L-arabinose transferase-like glycosyltransferase